MDGLPLRATALRSSTASEAAPPFVISYGYDLEKTADHGVSRPDLADTALPPIGVATKDGIAWTTPVYEITLQVRLRFLKKDPQSEGLHTHTNPLQLTVLITFDPSCPELNHGIVCRNNPVMYVDPSGNFSVDEALKSFTAGFAGGVAFVLSGGNFVVAGMVVGAVGGAMTGRGENVLIGAATGGALGGLSGLVATNFGMVGVYAMMAAGAGAAYAQGGLDGLAYYGAGLAGAYTGAFATQQILKAMTGVVQAGVVDPGGSSNPGAGDSASDGQSGITVDKSASRIEQRIRESVPKAVKALNEITEPSLRAYLKDALLINGVVKGTNEPACTVTFGSDPKVERITVGLADTPGPLGRLFGRNPVISLCVDNIIQYNITNLQGTLVHEFSHTWGWNHGDGLGVPGNEKGLIRD